MSEDIIHSSEYPAYIDRINKRSKLNQHTGCIEWTGSLNSHGYAEISIGGKRNLVHRIQCEIKHGKLNDLLALHKCDNRKCINPDHLYAGTQSQNMQDKFLRGRDNHARGERAGGAKLTEQDVLEIRSSSLTNTELAKIYPVNKMQIGRIRRRERWAHVI